MSNVIQVNFKQGEIRVGDVIQMPPLDGWFEVVAIVGDQVELIEVEENGGDCA